MYVGYWSANQQYGKGDIVYFLEKLGYYVCVITHISNDKTKPENDLLFWIRIDRSIFDNYISSLMYPYSIFQSNVNLPSEPQSTPPPEPKTEPEPQPLITIKIKSPRPPSPPKLTTSKSVPPKSEPESDEDNEVLSRVPKLRTPRPRKRIIAESPDDFEDQLRKKLRIEETKIQEYKKSKHLEETTSLKDTLTLLNVDISVKSFILDKYEQVQKASGSDYNKGMNWLKTVAGMPHGRYKNMKVTREDPPHVIQAFFNDIRSRLDKHILGLDEVKQEILEYVARKVSNPNGKGHILALCGSAGVGKSKILRSLAEALELPFYQINCGGLNDVVALTGHSETYVGSKPGKIVEILQNSSCMNPIIYLDEIDKISETKANEINGVLTHMLDEEQNNSFQDNYLSGVPIDLSKVLFVISFNDLSKVNEIVSDRLKIIYIEKPTLEEKVNICCEKMLPEIIQTINFDKNTYIQMDKEVIEYIALHKCEKESGVRQLRKAIEKIMNKLNYDLLVGNVVDLKISKITTDTTTTDTTTTATNTTNTTNTTDTNTTATTTTITKTIYNITTKYVDSAIHYKEKEQAYLSMYI